MLLSEVLSVRGVAWHGMALSGAHLDLFMLIDNYTSYYLLCR